MGKISRGILGGFSGRVANVVGSSWKGIAYMKSLPLSVANPRTAAQVAQRSLFANAAVFAKNILVDAIKPLWDRFAQKQSGYNAFIQANIDLFIGETPNPAVNLIFSQGQMALTPIDTLVGTVGLTEVAVSWLNDTGEGFKLATDIAYLLVINKTQGNYKAGTINAVRTDLSTTVDLPVAIAADDAVQVYLAFRRADGTIVSNSSTGSSIITI